MKGKVDPSDDVSWTWTWTCRWRTDWERNVHFLRSSHAVYSWTYYRKKLPLRLAAESSKKNFRIFNLHGVRLYIRWQGPIPMGTKVQQYYMALCYPLSAC